MNEIVDIHSNHHEAVQEGSRCDPKILGTHANTPLLYLSKNGISLFVEEENIPCLEIANSLNKGGMPLSRLVRGVSILVEIREPPLQLFLECNGGCEEVLARSASYFRSQACVPVLVVGESVGVEDKHRLTFPFLRGGVASALHACW